MRWWQHAQARAIAGVALALTLIGIVMTLSASYVAAADAGDPLAVLWRQSSAAAVAVVVFVVAASLPLHWWRTLSWVALPVATLLLAATLLPGIGQADGGAVRWLSVGPVRLQPSEIVKFAAVLWVAEVLWRKRQAGLALTDRTGHMLVPAVPLLAVLAVLLLAQPDFGSLLVLAGAVGVVLFSFGLRWRHILLGVAAGVAAAGVAAVAAPYRFQRLTGWWRAEDDPLSGGYQLLQSLYALGSGGLTGVGAGEGRAKWYYLPNPETDFIFSIIGEELGLVGGIAVLGLFGAIVALAGWVARRQRDGFAAAVCLAVAAMIGGQVVLNVGGVVGALPITGVTLPLVSVGGTSLVVTAAMLGFVARAATTERRQPSTTHSESAASSAPRSSAVTSNARGEAAHRSASQRAARTRPARTRSLVRDSATKQ